MLKFIAAAFLASLAFNAAVEAQTARAGVERPQTKATTGRESPKREPTKRNPSRPAASKDPAPATQPAAQPEQQGPPAAAAPSQTATTSNCLAELSALGLEANAAPAPANAAGACAIVEPVTLTAVHSAETGEAKISLPDKPLISCAMAQSFGHYVRNVLAPLAKGTFGHPVSMLGTGPGFECRTRNHVPGGKVSSHAQGNAIDIAGIALADGTRIAIGAANDARTERFIAGLRAAGCGAFSTALGPGSDAAHATHLHFDILARGRDGTSKFCQ